MARNLTTPFWRDVRDMVLTVGYMLLSALNEPEPPPLFDTWSRRIVILFFVLGLALGLWRARRFRKEDI